MEKTREIIDDFAKVIDERKQEGPSPKTFVINFRNEMVSGKERQIYYVPIELLRYRKDNGRIVSDVLSYERASNKKLNETESETQNILFEFLKDKDPEKTETLKKNIKKYGQDTPVIITCDGFLINGNRRKMVFELLQNDDPSNYKQMKVVILPGKNDEGGPPTIKEIELLENRYQLQQDGKSEYQGLDRALSIRRKINNGVSLDEQLLDNPECAGLNINDKDFKKKKEEWINKYLNPLQQVDDYLNNLGRPEHYASIEGRWQSFIDLSNFYNGNLQKQRWRLEAELEESDIGIVQEVAFNIIRKQHISGRPEKLHNIIRKLPTLLKTPDAKEILFSIPNKTVDLTIDEKYDSDKKEYPLSIQDKKWSSNKVNENVFSYALNLAYDLDAKQKENEDSMALIKTALCKINHPNMNVEKIPQTNLKEFIKTAEKIIEDVTILKQSAWERLKGKK